VRKWQVLLVSMAVALSALPLIGSPASAEPSTITLSIIPNKTAQPVVVTPTLAEGDRYVLTATGSINPCPNTSRYGCQLGNTVGIGPKGELLDSSGALRYPVMSSTSLSTNPAKHCPAFSLLYSHEVASATKPGNETDPRWICAGAGPIGIEGRGAPIRLWYFDDSWGDNVGTGWTITLTPNAEHEVATQDIEVVQGAPAQNTVDVTDAEGDPIDLALAPGEPGTLEKVDGIWTWSSGEGDTATTGAFEVNFSATDGYWDEQNNINERRSPSFPPVPGSFTVTVTEPPPPDDPGANTDPLIGHAKISGKINEGGAGGKPGSHSFDTLENGDIAINYKILNVTCLFTPVSGIVGAETAPLSGTLSCPDSAVDATLTLTVRTLKASRGWVALEAGAMSISSSELVTGNVILTPAAS